MRGLMYRRREARYISFLMYQMARMHAHATHRYHLHRLIHTAHTTHTPHTSLPTIHIPYPFRLPPFPPLRPPYRPNPTIGIAYELPHVQTRRCVVHVRRYGSLCSNARRYLRAISQRSDRDGAQP